jgi:hypothetical protein
MASIISSQLLAVMGMVVLTIGIDHSPPGILCKTREKCDKAKEEAEASS